MALIKKFNIDTEQFANPYKDEPNALALYALHIMNSSLLYAILFTLRQAKLSSNLKDGRLKVLIGLQKKCRKLLIKFRDQKTAKFNTILLPSKTMIFRGTKKKQVLENMATYFAPDIRTAALYLPSKNNGYLNIYETTKPAKLFILDDLDNANKILREQFNIDKDLYVTMRIVYGRTTAVLEKDIEPHQMIIVDRASYMDRDFKFSNWLCHNGFDGYISNNFYWNSNKKIKFPAEIMICNPTIQCKLIKSIQMKKPPKKNLSRVNSNII